MLQTFFLYIQNGGVVNGVIAVTCCVTLFIGFGKFFQYRMYMRPGKLIQRLPSNKEPQIHSELFKKDWLLKFLIDAYRNNPQRSRIFYYNLLREKLLQTVPELEDGLDTMGVWISAAPLLGLLGTVVGMVKTFTIITTFGVGNPNVLSEGISVALLTTQSGLVVAFPCLLFHNYLLNQKNMIVKTLIADGEAFLNWVEKRNREC